MSGVKGRSGRANTQAKRRAKAAGGVASGKSRRKKLAAPMMQRVGGDDLRNRPELEAGSMMSLADYDNQVGLPVSWADAIKREQLVGEKVANESKQLALDQLKGKLLTEKQVTDRDDLWNKAAADEAEKVQRLVDAIDGITPEQRKVYLDRFRDWRKQLNVALAKALT